MAAKYFWTEFPSYFTTDNFLWIGGDLPKKLFNLQRTFSPRKTGVWLKKVKNKNAPGLGKSGSIVICGYEISENSKHSRCPYTAAKWVLRPVGQSAHLFLLGIPKPRWFYARMLTTIIILNPVLCVWFCCRCWLSSWFWIYYYQVVIARWADGLYGGTGRDCE